jgi:hypothetical protein
MPTLDVSVVGEINLDLILYGLPKQLVLDRELLASGARAHPGQFVRNFCA